MSLTALGVFVLLLVEWTGFCDRTFHLSTPEPELFRLERWLEGRLRI